VLRSPKPIDRAYPTELRTIGDHIRKRRLDLKLRQQDVAARIGVDKTSVFNWEAGTASPHIRALPAVIRFLGYDPSETGTTLGERLRAARRRLGLSHFDLAQQLGVDPTTLRNWEVGRRNPPVRYLPRIHRVIGSETVDPAAPFSERLLAYRRTHGLRQRDLGRLLGVDQREISEWERGVPPATSTNREVIRRVRRLLGECAMVD
jgi:transcriptional regulator with XRE-family HTH domain